MYYEKVFEILDFFILWLGGLAGLAAKHFVSASLDKYIERLIKVRKYRNRSKVLFGLLLFTPIITTIFISSISIYFGKWPYPSILVTFSIGFFTTTTLGLGIYNIAMNMQTETSESIVKLIVIKILQKITGIKFDDDKKEIQNNISININKSDLENYLPKSCYDEDYRASDPEYTLIHCGQCSEGKELHNNPTECANAVIKGEPDQKENE